MVSKYQRQPFIANGRYVARKVFTCNGHRFKPGDAFPWRRMGCSARRLEIMYRTNLIDLNMDVQYEEEPKLEPGADEEPRVEFEFDPEMHEVRHWYSGKFKVTEKNADQDVVLAVVDKAAAELLKAAEGKLKVEVQDG